MIKEIKFSAFFTFGLLNENLKKQLLFLDICTIIK